MLDYLFGFQLEERFRYTHLERNDLLVWIISAPSIVRSPTMARTRSG
jgi:hypothetical protein